MLDVFDGAMCDKKSCMYFDHAFCMSDCHGITPNSDRCEKFSLCANDIERVHIRREINRYMEGGSYE